MTVHFVTYNKKYVMYNLLWSSRKPSRISRHTFAGPDRNRHTLPFYIVMEYMVSNNSQSLQWWTKPSWSSTPHQQLPRHLMTSQLPCHVITRPISAHFRGGPLLLQPTSSGHVLCNFFPNQAHTNGLAQVQQRFGTLFKFKISPKNLNLNSNQYI